MKGISQMCRFFCLYCFPIKCIAFLQPPGRRQYATWPTQRRSWQTTDCCCVSTTSQFPFFVLRPKAPSPEETGSDESIRDEFYQSTSTLSVTQPAAECSTTSMLVKFCDFGVKVNFLSKSVAMFLVRKFAGDVKCFLCSGAYLWSPFHILLGSLEARSCALSFRRYMLACTFFHQMGPALCRCFGNITLRKLIIRYGNRIFEHVRSVLKTLICRMGTARLQLFKACLVCGANSFAQWNNPPKVLNRASKLPALWSLCWCFGFTSHLVLLRLHFVQMTASHRVTARNWRHCFKSKPFGCFSAGHCALCCYVVANSFSLRRCKSVVRGLFLRSSPVVFSTQCWLPVRPPSQALPWSTWKVLIAVARLIFFYTYCSRSSEDYETCRVTEYNDANGKYLVIEQAAVIAEDEADSIGPEVDKTVISAW